MAVIMKAHKFADPEVSHIHEIDKLEDALIDELFYQEDEIGTFTFSVKISSGTVWVCVYVCVCVCVCVCDDSFLMCGMVEVTVLDSTR